jgi:hypothetical protein
MSDKDNKKDSGAKLKNYVCLEKPQEFGSKMMDIINAFPDDKKDNANNNLRNVAKAIVMSFILGSSSKDDISGAFSGYTKSESKYSSGGKPILEKLPSYVAKALNDNIDEFSGENTTADSITGAVYSNLFNPNIIEGKTDEKKNKEITRESCYDRVGVTIQNIFKVLTPIAKKLEGAEKNVDKLQSLLDDKIISTSDTQPPAKHTTILQAKDKPVNIRAEVGAKDAEWLEKAVRDFESVWARCNKFFPNLYRSIYGESLKSYDPDHVAIILRKIVDDTGLPDSAKIDRLSESQMCDLIRAIIVLLSSRIKLTGQQCHMKLKALLDDATLRPFVRAHLMMKNHTDDISTIENNIYGNYNIMTKMMNDIIEPKKNINFFNDFRAGNYGKRYQCRINGRPCRNNFEAFIAFYQNVEGSFIQCLNEIRLIEENARYLSKEYASYAKGDEIPDLYHIKKVDTTQMSPYSWLSTETVRSETEPLSFYEKHIK